MHQSLKSQRNDLILMAWFFAGLMMFFLVYLITHGMFAVHCWLADMPQKVSKWAFAEGRGEVDRLSFSSPWDPKASNNRIVAEVTVRQPLHGRLVIRAEDATSADRFYFSNVKDNNQNTCTLIVTSIPAQQAIQEKCEWTIAVDSRLQLKGWGRRLFTPGWLEKVHVALFYQEPLSSSVELIKNWSAYTTFPYADRLWKWSFFFIVAGFFFATKDFAEETKWFAYVKFLVELISNKI